MRRPSCSKNFTRLPETAAGRLHAAYWPPETGTAPLEGLADLAGLLVRELLAATVLHAQQLGHALVVFVIAGGREVHLHEVEHFYRRLIEKQRETMGEAPIMSPAVTSATWRLAWRRWAMARAM
jgi:hypothetical protein